MFEILLILICLRPLISSLTFPYADFLYSYTLLIFLVIWLIYNGVSTKKIQAIKYPFGLFCLALIVSIIFSSNKLNSLQEIYKYITALFLFLITFSLAPGKKRRLIQTIIFTGFIISLLAIYQYFFGFKHILEYITHNNISSPFILDYIGRKRIFFPFVTPNTLASYLIMIIPLTLTDKRNFWFIIPLSFALLLTQSLGALLSIFLGLIIYFYLVDKLNKRKVVFFFLGLIIIIGAIFIMRTATQKQHIQPIFSTIMRLNYWKDTLKIIKASPLTGVGLGNFNLAQSRYAHNSYLQIWAEMGILGIISFIWLISSVFKSVFNSIKTSPHKKQIIVLVTSAVIFLIHNLIDFSLFLPEVALIWWVILGLLHKTQSLKSMTPSSDF
ncbi:MAG: O-antigen ligase family protein [Candidatus Omnitrophica bacterium]|nr:O-antigen ligase family protein [Candidatus Omnitrophota bacterium]